MRPKRELLALLQRLNNSVGISARHVYTRQIAVSELLQCPQSEIRRQLPELCDFVDSLSSHNSNATGTPPSSLVRRAFRHPDAQWLSRSARESGVSALVCQQLVRLARQDSNDELVEDNTTNWSAAELTMHVLLDALLSPCAQRLGKAPDACKWRATQPKPRFHAMTCFPVWSTLLPFAALMGLRFPGVFLRVLLEYRQMETKKKKQQQQRVNCSFAQITGIWRLVEELNRGDKESQSAVTEVMVGLLRLASDKVLATSVAVKNEKKTVGLHLDDQLMEKFSTGLQGFSFKSWRANAVLKPALFDALQSSLSIPADEAKGVEIPQRVAVFAAVGCIFVKDLAADIVSTLIERASDTVTTSGAVRGPLLNFLVGFCAHVDLVSLTSVIEMLEFLVAAYKAVPQNEGDLEPRRAQQLELVFCIVYVALHRCQSVDTLRQEVSSDAAEVKERLAQLQMRLCSDVAFEDFYVAAPLHWTAKVLGHWVFLSDEEVQAFSSEAEENDNDSEKEFRDRVEAWHAIEARFASKPESFSAFTQMKTLLEPHLRPSIPLDQPTHEHGLILPAARKRRRTDEVTRNSGDPDKLERSIDVLLLPDVMERVCSFMSAKRLCRMALVCRTFADISHRASLWRPLYMRVGFPIFKTNALPPASVACHHGEKYAHNWRQLYQERLKAVKRLRRVQRRVLKAGQSNDQEDGNDSSASGSARATAFIPQLCAYCSCDQVLKSAVDLETHQTQHKRFTCTEASCRASFTGLHKFNAHMRGHAVESSCRLVCGFTGCKKSYSSAKRLASHRQKEGHQTQEY
ncbi:F-box domain [Phytophthora infestans]|uniref:F-box domain n=1 Tax=Phytophthora infestans TaxID=4787 RepID=A0A833T0G3_PHYIN|nr:F-box domain [Phytophthora infestans]KAF4130734.1 F-box domain [Phytophthora infestans]